MKTEVPETYHLQGGQGRPHWGKNSETEIWRIAGATGKRNVCVFSLCWFLAEGTEYAKALRAHRYVQKWQSQCAGAQVAKGRRMRKVVPYKWWAGTWILVKMSRETLEGCLGQKGPGCSGSLGCETDEEGSRRPVRRLLQRSRQRRWGCYGDGKEFKICVWRRIIINCTSLSMEKEKGEVSLSIAGQAEQSRLKGRLLPPRD